MLRGLRCCLSLIGLLVVIGAGIAAYLIVARPGPARPLGPPSTAAPSARAAAPAASALEARLASAEAAIRSNASAGRHVPVSFSVTEAELTARVNQALAQGEVQAPLSDVSVAITPGQVAITGKATRVAPLSVPFTITAVPRVNAGKAQLQVTGVDFGNLPVPGPLASQLSSLVGSDNLLGDLPLTVTGFRAEQGRLVLDGTT